MLFAGAAAMTSGCSSDEFVAGIDGSGNRVYAQGSITAFGSIVVNDVHYEVDSASILVNGENAFESDLALGQVVAVDATLDPEGNAIAETVNFEANLRGPIESLDALSGIVVVLAQEVRTNVSTVFAIDPGVGVADLAVGDFVEVSGLVGAGGAIVATRVAGAAASDGLQLVGEASGLDNAAFSFSIGALDVDYSGAGLIEGFPFGGPQNGDTVLVRGDGLGIGGELLATRLRLIDDDSSNRRGQEAEVEGLITRFESLTDFDVAGQAARVTASTVYEGGDASDLQPNVKIQIEGQFDLEGTIVAVKVEVKDGGAVQ